MPTNTHLLGAATDAGAIGLYARPQLALAGQVLRPPDRAPAIEGGRRAVDFQAALTRRGGLRRVFHSHSQ